LVVHQHAKKFCHFMVYHVKILDISIFHGFLWLIPLPYHALFYMLICEVWVFLNSLLIFSCSLLAGSLRACIQESYFLSRKKRIHFLCHLLTLKSLKFQVLQIWVKKYKIFSQQLSINPHYQWWLLEQFEDLILIYRRGSHNGRFRNFKFLRRHYSCM